MFTSLALVSPCANLARFGEVMGSTSDKCVRVRLRRCKLCIQTVFQAVGVSSSFLDEFLRLMDETLRSKFNFYE